MSRCSSRGVVRPSFVVLAPLALALAGGCSGQLAGGGPGTEPGDETPGATAGKGGGTKPPAGTAGTGDPVVDPPPGGMPTAAAPAGPLVRISPAQLDNIAHDVLGVAAPPASEFPDIPTNDTKLDPTNTIKAHLAAADVIAQRAFTAPAPLASACATAASADTSCADTFITTQGRLLFRRAVTAEEKTALMKVFTANATTSYKDGLRETLVAMLMSTPFLYRVELPGNGKGLSPSEVATRMSFLAWASGPTAELLDLADKGGLATGAQRAKQLDTMLATDKGKRGMGDLVTTWLGTRKVVELVKEGTAAKDFSADLATAMVTETERFAAETLTAPNARFEDLLTSTDSFVTSSLAKLYGATGGGATTFDKTKLPATQRSGILTQASVLTLTSNRVEASPVERGVFIFERLLCQLRPEVPQDVPALPPAMGTGGKVLSQRERLELHRSQPSCKACHAVFDGYGLGLENYDLIGHYMDKEGTTTLTGDGEVELDGKSSKFKGALELGKLLAASPTARRCFVQRARTVTSGLSFVDPQKGAAADAFVAAGDMRKLLTDLVSEDAFAARSF